MPDPIGGCEEFLGLLRAEDVVKLMVGVKLLLESSSSPGLLTTSNDKTFVTDSLGYFRLPY